MERVLEYLVRAVKEKGSDLFLVAGSPVNVKRGGGFVPLEEGKLTADGSSQLIRELYDLAKRDMDQYMETGDDDYSFAVPGLARFRVNAFRQRGSLAAVIRVVAFEIPDYRQLGIPERVMDLADLTGGLVLVTGVAGSGKSTTQACIIDRINHNRQAHIITLEDPIEYLHRNVKSIVSQREIATDTRDYLSALRSCLRQAPDVILLGEMRDHETIHTAMTAAETGHLVLATMHTSGVVNAIDRIVDSFPSQQQGQIRTQLSMVLRSVVSQRLLPGRDGGEVVACEVLHTDSAIRTMIRENKGHQINNAIAAGNTAGMISMDQALLELVRSGRITKEVALATSENREWIQRRLEAI